MSSDVIVRRATADDYDAVMKILPDVFQDGDYMPTLYYSFLQTKRHVIYVAETPDDGRLISLVGLRITDDGRTALMMSARTVKEFQSTGVIRRLYVQIPKHFPDLEKCLIDGDISDGSKRMLHFAKRLYEWSYIAYELSPNGMPEFSAYTSVSATVKRLTVSESIELVKSGACERFLRRFADDYIPSPEGHWGPMQLVESDLLEMVKKASNVVVTEVVGGSRELRSASFSLIILLKTARRSGQVKMQVQYFGDNVDDLVAHTTAHLSREIAVAGRNPVVFTINFPTSIQLSAVEKRISENAAYRLRQIFANSAYLAQVSLTTDAR